MNEWILTAADGEEFIFEPYTDLPPEEDRHRLYGSRCGRAALIEPGSEAGMQWVMRETGRDRRVVEEALLLQVLADLAERREGLVPGTRFFCKRPTGEAAELCGPEAAAARGKRATGRCRGRRAVQRGRPVGSPHPPIG